MFYWGLFGVLGVFSGCSWVLDLGVILVVGFDWVCCLICDGVLGIGVNLGCLVVVWVLIDCLWIFILGLKVACGFGIGLCW